MTISEKIEKILSKRRELVPTVKSKLYEWEELSKEISLLKSALKNISEYKNASPEIKSLYEEFEKQPFGELIYKTMELFEIIKNRMKRETINIGVSGHTKVGKSTLLQSISGLSDDQIPTSEGNPVTAVRSQIFHSLDDPRAVIRFHDYSSFREDVLKPYHKELEEELGFVDPPDELSDFQNYSYPGDKLCQMDEVKAGLYRRLRGMHEALFSYKKYLTRDKREQVFDLSEIKGFVSYPDMDQANGRRSESKYLAVQNIRIECKFPQLEIQKIGLIDLPGLGELTANAEKHHISGLRNDVDFVLFIKSPGEKDAFLLDHDYRALKTICEACGTIKKRDFICIVLNERHNIPETYTDNLLNDILKNLNDGIDGKNYKVLKTDAKNQNNVYQNIVNPVLEHLSDRLAAMDMELFEDANKTSKRNARKIKDNILSLYKKIEEFASAVPTDEEKIVELTKNMHEQIAHKLRKIVENLFYKARYSDYNKVEDIEDGDLEITKLQEIGQYVKKDDEKFIDKVLGAEQEFNEWLKKGFDYNGKNEWIEKTEQKISRRLGIHHWAQDEYNRIRVHLSEQFSSSLDIHLKNKIQELRSEIGKAVRSEMGILFEGVEDNEVLSCFAKFLEQSRREKCPTMLKSVKEMLATDITYRSHLHPRVRRCLDNLKYTKPEKDYKSHELFDKLAFESKDAARAVKHGLVEEINFIHKILHTTCEQFDDSLIRSADSEKEFNRFARAYKHRLWPDKFIHPSSDSPSIDKILTHFESVIGIIDKIEEVKNV